MTPEHIKEHLSNRFIGILAANKGFVIDKPELDYGVDFLLRKTTSYTTLHGDRRHTYDSRYIDLQLKSTTENSIIDEATLIRYDLEAKSYNDLVERLNNGTAPLVLILFVLPADVNTWVAINADEIRLRKHAYWYQPPVGAVMTNNTQSIRIEIPKTNMLDIDCFNQMHARLYP